MVRVALLAVVLAIAPAIALADATRPAPPAGAAQPAQPGQPARPGQPAHPANPAHPGKPYPRPTGYYPGGYQQPQVYIDGSSYVTPRPSASPARHTGTPKPSTNQTEFHSYSTGN